MLTVVTLLKMKPSPNGHLHGERPFWREFGGQYLAAWLAGVRKYIPDSKRIVVMTDAPATVMALGVESVELDRTVDAPGFWAKLNMFREEVSTGKTLYIDLDNVLCGDLSELCALTPDPLVMLDDRRVPRLPNGSVMLFEAERCRGVWEYYASDPRAFERAYVAHGEDFTMAYDQAFIADCIRADTSHDVPFFQDMLPPDYILNADSELPHTDDWRSARMIVGSGAKAKPHLMQHQVFAENWAG